MEQYLHFEPNDSRTQPLLKGTKISINLVLERLADGWTIEAILHAFPGLTHDGVLRCLRFGSELVTEAYTERMKRAQVLADRIRKLKINPEQ